MYFVPNGYRSVHNMPVYMKMRVELIRETKNMFPRKIYCMWLTMPEIIFICLFTDGHNPLWIIVTKSLRDLSS